MKHTSPFLPILILLAVLLSATNSLSACTVCFGKVNGDLAHGLNMALVLLLAVTTSVLGGFAAFFIYLWRRSKAIQLHHTFGEHFHSNPNPGGD